MLSLNESQNTALIIVTHDMSIASSMQFQWEMHDGKLAGVQ
jgi:ABC-type lipoprotein export system ATPase subunit